MGTYSPWRLFVSLVGWQVSRAAGEYYSFVFVGNWYRVSQFSSFEGRIRVKETG
jgi:hypothetical protein